MHWIHCELQAFKRNRNKHILHTNWCEIHSSDFWSFGDQKHSDSVAEFVLYTRVETLLTRNLTGLWFLLHVMRDEIEKIVRLGARLRKPSRPLPTYLTTTRTIYQGSEAGQSARRISGRYCVNRERRSRTCWPTLGSHGNRSWQEILRYLYGCCQLMLNFKATSSNQSPFEPRELHTLDNQSPGEQGLKPLKQILDISLCAPLHCLPISISPLHLNKLFARTVLGCRNVCKALNTKTLLTVFFLSWYNWESPSLVGKLDFELHIVIEARV